VHAQSPCITICRYYLCLVYLSLSIWLRTKHPAVLILGWHDPTVQNPTDDLESYTLQFQWAVNSVCTTTYDGMACGGQIVVFLSSWRRAV
jgi:hypothetical protein